MSPQSSDPSPPPKTPTIHDNQSLRQNGEHQPRLTLASPSSDLTTTTTTTNTHTLTHLTGPRSFPTAALQTLIKPLKPRLISPPKDAPQLDEHGGRSPRLTPPQKLRVEERREEEDVGGEGVWVYDVVAAKPEGRGARDRGVEVNSEEKRGRRRKVKRVYYFAGGGFVAPPSKDHWGFVGEVGTRVNETEGRKNEEKGRAKRGSVRLREGSTDDWNHRCMANAGRKERVGEGEGDDEGSEEGEEAVMTVVSLPLAPATRAPVALPLLDRWLGSVLRRDDGEDVVLMGDSSGGNLALTLVLNHYNEVYGEVVGEAKTVRSVVLISPTLDLEKANPDMKEAEKRDPVQTFESSKEGAEQWRGDWEAKDARLSPLFVSDESLKILAEKGIQVHGICGSHDILYPDFVLMRKRLEENGVGGEWLQWEKQMHCFPLAWQYGLKESVQGKDWVVEVVRRC